MRVKIFTAATMPEALSQARSTLGPDALIIATRRISGGVEVTAAIEPADDHILIAPLPAEPAAGAQAATLAWHGVPPSLSARLQGPGLAEALGRALRFGPLPVQPHGRPLLLTGPPGAGKTLTIARLATRFVLGGIHPMVITTDTRRAGAAEELAAYTRLLGITLVVASAPQNLAATLARRPPGMPVLIDTAGINPYAQAQREATASLIAAADALPALVLGGALDPLEAAELAQAMLSLGITYLVPTRLDMTRRLGWVLSAATSANLILGEAGTGPGATDGLTELTPSLLAARLLQAAPEPSAPAPPPATAPSRHPAARPPSNPAPLPPQEPGRHVH